MSASKWLFKTRIESLFSDYELTDDYRENPEGRTLDREDCPWVEFGLMGQDAADLGTTISLRDLTKLAALLGADDVEVVGQVDLEGRQYQWITASGVEFGQRKIQ